MCHRYNNDVIFSRRHPLIRGIFIKPSLVHFFSQRSGFLSVFKKRIQWLLKKNVIHKLIYAIKRLLDGDGVPTGYIGSPDDIVHRAEIHNFAYRLNQLKTHSSTLNDISN